MATLTEPIAATIPPKGEDYGLDINKIRRDFPMLEYRYKGKKLIYFDSAATNHKPKQVIERMNTLYSKEYGKPQEEHELSKQMSTEVENTRKKIARFLNARSEKQIVFTSGSTESINIVANGFGKELLQEDDEVLITALEHHANIAPWQMACQQSGARIVVAPIDKDGLPDLESFKNLITKKTKIISVSHTSHVLGAVLPIDEIIEMAHRLNIPVLVDAAQSAPHMPVDVTAMDCDFLVFSIHKMGGPAGVGVLYGKTKWLNKIPPQKAGSENTKKVTYHSTKFESVPKKFEAGTSAFEEIAAVGTLIDYLEMLNMSKTSEYEKNLMKYLTRKLSQVDKVKLFGLASEKEPVLSMAIDGMDVTELETYLSENYNICVRSGDLSAQPLLKHLGEKALLRVSLCYYNTSEEVDTFVSAVTEYIAAK